MRHSMLFSSTRLHGNPTGTDTRSRKYGCQRKGHLLQVCIQESQYASTD